MKKNVVVATILAVLLLALSVVPVTAAPVEKVDVIIGFDRQPGPSEEALINSYGGDIKYTYTIIPGIAAAIPESAISGLLRNPRVIVIQPDVEIHASGEYPWGVVRIGAEAVHQNDITGSGIKIAVIDSGIDYNHPEFTGIYKGGWDFVNNDDDPMDDYGHGTHVAGIIAAKLDLDDDIYGDDVTGVAPGVELYALKVLDHTGTGSFMNVVAALEWATGGSELPGSTRVDITNNSYGSPQNPDSPFFPLVQTAFDLSYYSDHVLNVAAAGNSGNTSGGGNNVEYPARYNSVIAVAATDQNDMRAYFSSTGPAVELAAPGVIIKSTIPGENYASFSGTSMASPHVAGVAALVMATNPGWTHVEVREHLQQAVEDLGDSGRDNLYGYGLINAVEAVLGTSPPPPPPSEEDHLEVSIIETGIYSAKGKNKIYTKKNTFEVGDAVVIRTQVVDSDNNPVANATVEISITGPETVSLTTDPSDNQGWAEAIWRTQAARKKRPGTTVGAYTATTTNVTASGYIWGQNNKIEAVFHIN